MAKSRKRIAQGRKIQAMLLEKIAIANAEIIEEETMIIPQNDVEMPISWKNATANTDTQKYVHKFQYARETISRKKSALAKAAIGSSSLDNFVVVTKRLAPLIKQKRVYQPRRPDSITLEKIRNVLPLVQSKLSCLQKLSGEQYSEKTSQYIKYMVVKDMMRLLLEGESYYIASIRAVQGHWPESALLYRRRVAQVWMEMMLETGSIPLHQQGKHVKRRSILSDPDVKERCVNWLRGQRPTKRSIPALRQFIRQQVFPAVLDITENVEADGDVIVAQKAHPLSNDALSTYLKSWGFNYKTGKCKLFCLVDYNFFVMYRQG